jgi:hypothetical protein
VFVVKQGTAFYRCVLSKSVRLSMKVVDQETGEEIKKEEKAD